MTYPSIEAYTADVIAARNAYANDMSVQLGLCVICHERKIDPSRRKCWGCRKNRRVEVSRR